MKIYQKYGLSYGISPHPKPWDASEEIVFFSQTEVNWMRHCQLDQDQFRYAWLAKKEDPKAPVIIEGFEKNLKEVFGGDGGDNLPDTWVCRNGSTKKHFVNPHAKSVADRYAPEIMAMLRGSRHASREEPALASQEIPLESSQAPMLQSSHAMEAIEEPKDGALSRRPQVQEQEALQPLLPSLA